MAHTVVDRPDKVRIRPLDLSAVPHVDALLVRLGLGPFDPDTVTSARGRNDNWSGVTTRGSSVFVKRLTDLGADARLRRSETMWEAMSEASRDHRLPTPRLLGTDPEHATLVFAHLGDADTGAELADRDEFDEALSARAGEILAEVHGLDIGGLDTSEHPLPPEARLEAVPFALYTDGTAAEISLWRVLHGDPSLIEALRDLRARDLALAGSRRPVHGDVRLDQFLLADGVLHLNDFEEARLGDPARDVGAYAGEWLYRVATAIPTTLAGATSYGHVATHDEIVSTGVDVMEGPVSMIRAFWRAYRRTAPAAVTGDPDLAERAVAYAGWHMLDRLLASAGHTARLSPVNKAAAGIGRTVLLSPGDYTASLGLEETS